MLQVRLPVQHTGVKSRPVYVWAILQVQGSHSCPAELLRTPRVEHLCLEARQTPTFKPLTSWSKMIAEFPIEDIHPRTPVVFLARDIPDEHLRRRFDVDLVAPLVGMQPAYIRRALGIRGSSVSLSEVLLLLDLDAFAETFVPRSRVPAYLLGAEASAPAADLPDNDEHMLVHGSATELVRRVRRNSINCVVTSTPYWATRLYEDHVAIVWADGEVCPFGHEQTPEGFVRHTTELLYLLKPALTSDASVWWNLMDTYNTRTQIRENAAETLEAMRGNDARSWSHYTCRRYSAGHAFLKDGEQCLIPTRVAERASRIGYYVKSLITWKKTGSMPEAVGTRVTRELEHILHLSVQRNPYFDKGAYLRLPEPLGGRNLRYEAEKITDVWCLSTAAGADGHGAQFPVVLPARCIALSTRPQDRVLDLFVGSGTTTVAAARLGRRSIGFDVSDEYLQTAQRRLARVQSSHGARPA